MIEVKELKKVYQSKKHQTVALDGVSLTLPDSGMVFLLGKSGCGKTTFLNMLGAMDTFDGGDIIVEGRPLSALTDKERDAYRNTYVGFIFQEYNLIDDFDVEQNIAIAQELQRSEPDSEAISKLLASLDLEGLEKRKIDELSGGQRQRVAIARALIKNPRLLLCDEPTGALDSQSGENLMELLKDISRDRLVVVVTHDRDFAERYGDRIIELKDGKVVSDSAPFEGKENKENLTLTFARLKTRRAATIGLKTAIKKPLQLVTSVLLLTITVCMLGMSCLIATFDDNDAIKRTVYNADRPYTVEAANFITDGTNIGRNGETRIDLLMDDNDLAAYEERFGLPCMGAIRESYYFDGNVGENPTENSSHMYDVYSFNSCTALTQDIIDDFRFGLVGELPVDEDEIVISNYVLRIFMDKGYNDGEQFFAITSAQDMIGKELNFSSNPYAEEKYTICGVITNLDYDSESLSDAIDDTPEYYLKENLAEELDFYDRNYPYKWLFVSPAKFEEVKADVDNFYMSAGLLTQNFMRGEWGDTYVSWAARERSSLDIYDYKSDKFAENIADEALLYDDLKEGQCLLGLNELFAVIAAYDDIYLDDADRALYGCDTLDLFINKYYFDRNKIGRIIESDYSYLINDRYTLEDRVDELYRALRDGEYIVYGEVPMARLLWNDIADVVKKYTADMSIAIGGSSSRITEYELAGVVFDVHDSSGYGTLVLTRSDAETLTYGAFGNYYSSLVSAMPEGRSEVYGLYDDSLSSSYGLHFVMRTFEANVVADFHLQLSVAQQLCAIVCAILAVFACILLFNFIVASLKIREKDIHILKNLGAGRGEIFKIFFAESLLAVISGFVLGIICVVIGIVVFNGAYASIIHPALVALQFEWFVPLLILGGCLLIVFAILGLVTLIKKF